MRNTIRYIMVALALSAAIFVTTCKKGTQEGGQAPSSGVTGGAPSAPSGAMGTASISGVVRYSGPPPKARKVDVSADPYCVTANPGGLMVTPIKAGANGELEGALVYVKTGISGTYPAPSTPAVLDQKSCWYTPTVLAIQAGQTLEIRNSDETTHNIRTTSRVSNSFNISEAPKETKTKTLEKAETEIPVTCDVHPWMKGYVFVFPHPFFGVTGPDGKFTISGLPAGEYEVEVWHPELGASTQKITVSEGESAEASFTLEKKE